MPLTIVLLVAAFLVMFARETWPTTRNDFTLLVAVLLFGGACVPVGIAAMSS